MSTEAPNVTERAAHVEESAHPGDDHAGGHDRTYVVVALILAAITAVEVATFYLEEELGAILVPSLILMMVAKFAIVGAYFMHLKYDSALFTRVFVSGIVLAVAVYLTVLATFRYF
jgi:cytochrome c oxidase subunit IV